MTWNVDVGEGVCGCRMMYVSIRVFKEGFRVGEMVCERKRRGQCSVWSNVFVS